MCIEYRTRLTGQLTFFFVFSRLRGTSVNEPLTLSIHGRLTNGNGCSDLHLYAGVGRFAGATISLPDVFEKLPAASAFASVASHHKEFGPIARQERPICWFENGF